MFIYGISQSDYFTFQKEGCKSRIWLRTTGPRGKPHQLAEDSIKSQGVRVYLWRFAAGAPRGEGLVARGRIGAVCEAGEPRVHQKVADTNCIWLEDVEWQLDIAPMHPEFLKKNSVELPKVWPATVVGAVSDLAIEDTLERLWTRKPVK